MNRIGKKQPRDTTTASGHTEFALYEAYGTRPYEWGSDPDRFKNNTKPEEADLGLIDDGMRWRDRICYLTRDPIGYADGPNLYCYVHCNPITHFDAWGLDDQEDLNKKQAQINSKRTEADNALALAKYERDLAMEDAKDNRERSNIRRKYDRAKRDHRKAHGQLDKRQDQLSQSQAELNNNRFGNTDIPNSGAGQPRRTYVDDNGVPIIGYWADNTHDVQGGKVYEAKASKAEISMYFKKDAQGRLVPKTYDEMVAGTTSAMGDMGNALAPVAYACDGAAMVYGAAVAWPALVPMAQGALNYGSAYVVTHPVQSFDMANTAVHHFSHAPPQPYVSVTFEGQMVSLGLNLWDQIKEH